MSRGIGFYLDLMDLISSGSMTFQLTRASNIAKLTVTRNEITVDIDQPGMAYDIFHPMLVVSKDGTEVKAVKRGTKWRSNTMLIKQFLKLFEGMEDNFVSKGKVLRLQTKGKDVLVMGPGESSLMARIAGLKHTSLPHKMHLIWLAKDFWISRPDKEPPRPKEASRSVKKDQVGRKRKGLFRRLFGR